MRRVTQPCHPFPPQHDYIDPHGRITRQGFRTHGHAYLARRTVADHHKLQLSVLTFLFRVRHVGKKQRVTQQCVIVDAKMNSKRPVTRCGGGISTRSSGLDIRWANPPPFCLRWRRPLHGVTGSPVLLCYIQHSSMYAVPEYYRKEICFTCVLFFLFALSFGPCVFWKNKAALGKVLCGRVLGMTRPRRHGNDGGPGGRRVCRLALPHK